MEAARNPVQAAPLKQECMRGSNRTPNRHVVLQSYTLQRSFAPLNSQARSPPTAHIAKALLGSGVDVPAGDVPEASAAADDSWSLGAQGSAVFPVKLKLQVRIWASGQPRQLAAFVTPLHFPAWLRAAFTPFIKTGRTGKSSQSLPQNTLLTHMAPPHAWTQGLNSSSRSGNMIRLAAWTWGGRLKINALTAVQRGRSRRRR